MLIALAAPRFHRVGYHNVALADVAREAGVTAPALYRHFGSKEGLLAETIASGLELVETAGRVHIMGSLEEVVGALADVGLRRPDLWVLLQREARYLGEDHRRAVQAQLGRVVAMLVERLRQERSNLDFDDTRMLVVGATSVLSTPSLFQLSSSQREQRQELVGAAVAVLRANVSGKRPIPRLGRIERPEPADRRSQLLQHAIDLFFERGYAAVTLDDIGASVGIAGPSIYHHFATKIDLLVAAVDHAVVLLQEGREEVAPELPAMVDWYVDLCLRNRALLGVYVSEAVNLPAEVRRRISVFLDEETLRWSGLLRRMDATIDRPAARLRVQAALTLISDLARLGRLYQRPGIADDIRAAALAVLTQPHCASA